MKTAHQGHDSSRGHTLPRAALLLVCLALTASAKWLPRDARPQAPERAPATFSVPPALTRLLVQHRQQILQARDAGKGDIALFASHGGGHYSRAQTSEHGAGHVIVDEGGHIVASHHNHRSRSATDVQAAVSPRDILALLFGFYRTAPSSGDAHVDVCELSFLSRLQTDPRRILLLERTDQSDAIAEALLQAQGIALTLSDLMVRPKGATRMGRILGRLSAEAFQSAHRKLCALLRQNRLPAYFDDTAALKFAHEIVAPVFAESLGGFALYEGELDESGNELLLTRATPVSLRNERWHAAIRDLLETGKWPAHYH